MKRRRLLLLALVSLVGVSLTAGFGLLQHAEPTATGAEIVVHPIADAYVDSVQSDKNFGDRAALRVDGSPQMLSYIRFDLQDISEIDQAAIQIFAESPQHTGIELYLTSDGWGELSVTYANGPEPTSALIGASETASPGQWLTVDVTSVARPGTVLNLILMTNDQQQLKLASRESGDTSPRLNLTMASKTVASKPTAPVFTTVEIPKTKPKPAPTGTAVFNAGGDSLSLPIRAAFYYPWFPESWTQGETSPFTHYEPTLGFYDTGDAATIRQHIAWMQGAHIQAGIASWWGPGHHTDTDLKAILNATDGTGFKWAIYDEMEGQTDLSRTQIRDDLTYIRDNLASDSDYLRVDGRFVVFVYNADDTTCDVAERWMDAAADFDVYVVLKVFPGYGSCSTQPDSWHQYAPANSADRQKGYSYSISPGFWHANESSPRLERDPERWQSDVQEMVASGEPWQLITTFNEWGEGTAIEPATEWGEVYLDILAETWNGAVPTPMPEPTQGPSATATALPPGGDTIRIVAVGDIACDPSSDNWNNNSGTANSCRQKYTSDVALGKDPDFVVVLGDTQYENGSLDAYLQSYDPTWGRLKTITLPVAGNHEYQTSGAQGWHDYFDWGTSYYWRQLSKSWGLLVIDTDCSHVDGCGVGSLQYKFAESVLAAHPDLHFIVAFHHPYWTAGKYHNDYNSDGYRSLCLLYQTYGVDIMLSGHDHNYQRFAPQNCDGEVAPDGIQAFVAGTGGKNVYGVDPSLEPNLAFEWDAGYGVLVLDLRSDGYDWQFVQDDGTVIDSG